MASDEFQGPSERHNTGMLGSKSMVGSLSQSMNHEFQVPSQVLVGRDLLVNLHLVNLH